jgi:hypothetical protein
MKRLFLSAVAAFTLFAASAQAAEITGNLNLVGDFQPTVNGSATQNMALANGIDFLPLGGGMGAFQTLSGNGDLSAYANLTGGSIMDFTFAPFAPVGGFYSISNGGGDTLSFDLNSISSISQDTDFISISGNGTIHASGYDDTNGTFHFSGQSSNGTDPSAIFSWSAGSAAQPGSPVPEPATLSLLGLGLLAGGIIRRRVKNA